MMPPPVLPGAYHHRVAMLGTPIPHAMHRQLEQALGHAFTAPLALVVAKGKVVTGDMEGARRILAALVERRPWDETGWSTAAKLEEEDGNVDEARALIRSAMAVRAMPATGKTMLNAYLQRLAPGELALGGGQNDH